MNDIVERLRDWGEHCEDDCNEAADEILRLRAENEKLRAALKPFEIIAQLDVEDRVFFPVSIIRAAAAALKETE